jgi:hypothetical protein
MVWGAETAMELFEVTEAWDCWICETESGAFWGSPPTLLTTNRPIFLTTGPGTGAGAADGAAGTGAIDVEGVGSADATVGGGGGTTATPAEEPRVIVEARELTRSLSGCNELVVVGAAAR